jgi:hypothetical protein
MTHGKDIQMKTAYGNMDLVYGISSPDNNARLQGFLAASNFSDVRVLTLSCGPN